MNKQLKAIMSQLSDEAKPQFGELYTAIMDSNAAQAKAILQELETVEGLPVEAVDFLKKSARITIADFGYLSER